MRRARGGWWDGMGWGGMVVRGEGRGERESRGEGGERGEGVGREW